MLLAAGAWSGALAASIGLRLPVAPVRGQMLAVSNVPPLITRAMHGDDVYLVPRPSGEMLIGATVEHAGFLARGHARRPRRPHRRRGRPRARDRPPLDHPLLVRLPPVGRPTACRCSGPWPDVAGLFAATAHYRNGILLAPITAALLTGCIVDGDTPASITPFLPSRFLS